MNGSRRPGASRADTRPAFYFDLASASTYLAAERAERLFAALDWHPSSLEALHGGGPVAEEDRDALTARAVTLGMPLILPAGGHRPAPAAMRVASRAAELGCCGPFVLAASRLLFCGSFDVEEPDVLAEAGAAAGMSVDETRRAAREVHRDALIVRASRRLVAVGVDRLPAVWLGDERYSGEERIAEAAIAVANARRRRPQAPASSARDRFRVV